MAVTAEREAEVRRERGLDLVYVNPSAVYGPSPVHVGLNSFFLQLLTGKMPMVPPGGMSVVYVDGCTQAHVAAAERGVSGERYLVAFTSGERLAAHHPVAPFGMQRFDHPDDRTADVGNAVAFLAGENSGYITGTNLAVNGGLHMYA